MSFPQDTEKHRLLLVCSAYRDRGTPYIYGGNDPALMVDCSGSICAWLRRHGLWGERDFSAQMLHDYFTGKEVKLGGGVALSGDGIDCRTTAYRPGNVAFFGRDAAHISHVALLVDHFWMIEAAGGGSGTRTLSAAIAAGAKVQVSQIRRRSDLVVIVDPYCKKGIPSWPQ